MRNVEKMRRIVETIILFHAIARSSLLISITRTATTIDAFAETQR